MKSTVLLLSLALGSLAFADPSAPCKKAVIRQAMDKLASEIIVSGVAIKSIEVQGDDLNVFTLVVGSKTRSGDTRVTELYEARTDSSCRLQSLVAVPDSQSHEESGGSGEF